MQKKSILLAENLAYELSLDRTLFQKVQVSIEAGDRIALVGNNGVGKSTLLKILASKISPKIGSVLCHGVVYYLPQISTIKQEITVDTVLNFLISISDEWWKIEDILQTKFHTILDLYLPITNLSGGEITKLFLAIGLSQHPNLLLLDEPTK
ncbi:ATP-binding cassette domain-containing protein [Nostoc sp. JL34]|uniref:ATP-binding cassette domain-containing protein n=1 Tax=Nostoc sp. JL34 TaxID=2815397 RepID=UPI0025FB3ED1|nr:ATP-binding cassette domain-containing protein [Nostoc sp. JL34]